MKAIAITRYRGGLLLLCGLILFLMAPLSVWAQEEEIETPFLPEPSSTWTTKNGSVIEEGPPPSVRRTRSPRPQDKAVGERSPKSPWNHDVAPPGLEIPEVEDVYVSLAAAAPDAEGESKEMASKAATLAVTKPVVAVPDAWDDYELGLDGRLPENLQEGGVDEIASALRADMLEAPRMASPPQAAVSSKLLESGQTLAAVVEEGDLPTEYALAPNYPNPFNPATTIRFALPEASQVRIEVFDLLGRQVARLIDGALEAGRHEVLFDGRTLSSGLYVYRMDAGSFKQHRTMLLVK